MRYTNSLENEEIRVGLKILLKALFPRTIWIRLRRPFNILTEQLKISSIRAAVRRQGLEELLRHLVQIVPDITHQYTRFLVNTDYLRLKVRAVHAFQVALANEAIIRFLSPEKRPITAVDIGDSAGTHIQYLQELHKDIQLRCLSVNLDEEAVKKIREKNLKALHARAEDLGRLGIDADIFLCFETLEHLTSPVQFLKSLSDNTNCKALVITVPYVAQSRVGLHHIRASRQEPCNPESTHIFELSPTDWQLLFKYAGWSVVQNRLYLQYPTRGILRLTRRYWRQGDFEGFWGTILQRDSTWSNLCVPQAIPSPSEKLSDTFEEEFKV